MTVASTTSPASTGSDSISTLCWPAVVSRTTVRVSSAGRGTDFSLLGGWGAAVGVALAQPRVDHGADGVAVLGPDLGLFRRFRRFGVIRQLVALGLQLLDRRLVLGHRGRDVRQLDDVGLGPPGQFSQLGQRVVSQAEP